VTALRHAYFKGAGGEKDVQCRASFCPTQSVSASAIDDRRSETAVSWLFLPCTVSRGVDPYGTGGTYPPNIYEGGRPW